MISKIRTHSQQLIQPHFNCPTQLVAWMGAMQAQDYNMAKWALGIRTQSATLQSIDLALQKGDIMRPTWHFVPAKDLRWMLALSSKQVKAANKSMSKKYAITDEQFTKCNQLFVKILEGNRNLTKIEVSAEINKLGFATDPSHINRFLFHAESEGLICSGIDKAGKPTYALLDERVPHTKALHKDEALATLATRYFQSHSPATLDDFVWWSGLSITEARHAIHLIDSHLIADRFEGTKHLIHESYAGDIKADDQILHLLPSYDEYLISYKVRTDVVPLEHYSKAFNNYGIFQPVIMHNGKVVGNWKKAVKKNNIDIEISFFDAKYKVDKQLIEQAKEKYITYLK